MRVRIRRVRARTVFLMALLLYSLVGFLIGGVLFVLNYLHLVPAVSQTGLDRLGAWILLVFPGVYGLLGGFSGAVAAIFYNAIAAVMGGIEVDLVIREGRLPGGPPSVEESPPSAGDQDAASPTATTIAPGS